MSERSPTGNVTSNPSAAESGVHPDSFRTPPAEIGLSAFPGLCARHDVDPDEVLELFDESGYLALREGTTPDDGWYCADDPIVTQDVMYRAEDGALLGHVSITRGYSGCWLGHQIATLREHSEAMECRRSLYDFFSSHPRELDGPHAMLLGYYDRSRRWHKRFFEGFVQWMDDEGDAVVVPLDRFERDGPIQETRGHSAPPGVRIEVLEDADLAAATRLIRSHLPALAIEAFDLRPASLRQSDLHPAYRNSRYSRGRQALSLKEDDELVGVVLCEHGSSELSLFNILNMAQVFLATGDAAPRISSQLALLNSIRDFYAWRGVDHPLIVAPPETFVAAKAANTILAETMGCIVWSGRALHLYRHYLDEQFGPRPPKKLSTPRR
jgi:hypothetical protein